MRIKKGKVIIRKEDLTRKVALIANHESEEELQGMQLTVMESSLGCIAIPIASFKAYNSFRVKNKMKPKKVKDCLFIDLLKIREEENKNENNAKLHSEEGVQLKG